MWENECTDLLTFCHYAERERVSIRVSVIYHSGLVEKKKNPIEILEIVYYTV